jgi:hypothetical protein
MLVSVDQEQLIPVQQVQMAPIHQHFHLPLLVVVDQVAKVQEQIVTESLVEVVAVAFEAERAVKVHLVRVSWVVQM